MRRPRRPRRPGRPGGLGSAAAALLLLGAVVGPSACARDDDRRVVRVLGTWSGVEAQAFRDVVAPFEKRTGIEVRFEGTRDVSAVVAARIESGDPPEIAILSSPGDLLEYGGTDKLALLDDIRPDYPAEWLTPGQVNGRQVAVVLKAALKSTIWFDRAKLAAVGAPVPSTWAALVDTTAKLRAAGITPWCLGLASSTTSGWAGTDWIEDLVLARSGPAVYDRWADGDFAWSSPEIKAAWRDWGALITPEGTIQGGTMSALLTNHTKAPQVLRGDDVGCAFDHQGSFVSGSYAKDPSDPVPGVTYDAMPFPGFGRPAPREVAGDLGVLLRETPAARELLGYLTKTRAQEQWASSGTSLSPDPAVSASVYTDEVTGRLAGELASATSIRFDASDRMPAPMRSAFQRAVLAYVSNPADLDRILGDLDQVRATAY